MAIETPDATIADLVSRGSLRNPETYLIHVLNNMMLCKREFGDAVVRIGMTGDGVAPHYRVEPTEGWVMAELFDKDTAPYCKSYNGRGGGALKWGEKELKALSWSSKSMTLDAVRELIGTLRGKKR